MTDPVRIVIIPTDHQAETALTAETTEHLSSGLLHPLPPNCRYPAHREQGLDWITADGWRRHCGICTPPAPGAAR